MYKIVSISAFFILIMSLVALAIVDVKVNTNLIEKDLNVKPVEAN